MKRFLTIAPVLAFGLTTSALANGPSPEQIMIMGQYGLDCNHRFDGCQNQQGTSTIYAPPPKDYSGTTFAYNIKDGRWWASYNSNRGFSARSDCDADSKERYDYFWCNHDTKKGRKPMIVALGYDEAEQRYRMVSNANSRQTKPERILKECQSKGYVQCEIVFDGSQ